MHLYSIHHRWSGINIPSPLHLWYYLFPVIDEIARLNLLCGKLLRDPRSNIVLKRQFRFRLWMRGLRPLTLSRVWDWPLRRSLFILFLNHFQIHFLKWTSPLESSSPTCLTTRIAFSRRCYRNYKKKGNRWLERADTIDIPYETVTKRRFFNWNQ